MTFTPEVLSKTDVNNSTVLPSPGFLGAGTPTTGYNTVFVTVTSDVSSAAGGLAVSFSDDNLTWQQFYTDTYLAPSPFTRSYLIVKKFYRVSFTSAGTPSALNLTSRLSTQLSSSTTQTTSITVFDTTQESVMDAFGRVRMSAPYTLLDVRFPGQTTGSSSFKSNAQQISSLSSGSFSAVAGDAQNTISGTGTGYFISQSRNYCVYQPGKSLVFLASGVFDPQQATMTSRIGYCDHDLTSPPVVRNGIYFQISGGVPSFNIKNTTLTSVVQSDWNVDKMDGTGPSGLTLDFTKTQLLMFDMEWLGVGRVRCGFYAYGQVRYCHQFTHINVLTTPYTRNINLPVTYALLGNSDADTGSIVQICTTVMSEGGYNPTGRPFSVPTGIETNVGLTETPVLAIRGGAAGYYHQGIVPTGVSLIDSTNNNTLLYRLRMYPAGTSAGTITWTDVDSVYSLVQYANSANISSFVTTGSIVIKATYFLGKDNNVFSDLSSTFSSLLIQVTSNVSNVSDIMLLTCTRINSGTDAKVSASLSWNEVY